MKQYLQKTVKEIEKELATYKRKADKEKADKITQMEQEKQRRMKELAERQNRLVDLEEAAKRDELY
jgi:hypothetical protein